MPAVPLRGADDRGGSAQHRSTRSSPLTAAWRAAKVRRGCGSWRLLGFLPLVPVLLFVIEERNDCVDEVLRLLLLWHVAAGWQHDQLCAGQHCRQPHAVAHWDQRIRLPVDDQHLGAATRNRSVIKARVTASGSVCVSLTVAVIPLQHWLREGRCAKMAGRYHKTHSIQKPAWQRVQ